jgi:hypothetical protein
MGWGILRLRYIPIERKSTDRVDQAMVMPLQVPAESQTLNL